MICDPSKFDKTEAEKDAVEIVTRFLSVNSIGVPKFFNIECDYFGYYSGFMSAEESRVHYYLKRTKCPAIVPTRMWSFPGYKADQTVYGVVAHECGHHVWLHKLLLTRPRLTDERRLWNEIVKFEARVSSYEPNVQESFAEAFRLFVLNPSLLKAGRPRRYDFFKSVLCLEKIESAAWEEILVFSPKHIAAATNWIKAGSKELHGS